MAIEQLYEWSELEEGDLANGRPQWFKCWALKYADALDIDFLDDDLTQKEKIVLFQEVGKAFINALFYFRDHDEEKYLSYKPNTRDGRILWHALKRDIDQSYRDYDKRVENGRKGGRPKKEQTEYQ